MIGAWKGVNEGVTNHIDNNPVEFSGRGPAMTLRANGRGRNYYGKHLVYRGGMVNGNRWTEVFHGYVTYDWQIQGRSMDLSDIKPHGTWELLENGAYNNGGPLSLATGPGSFSCSGDTLRFYDNSGSTVLKRVLPKPQPGS